MIEVFELKKYNLEETNVISSTNKEKNYNNLIMVPENVKSTYDNIQIGALTYFGQKLTLLLYKIICLSSIKRQDDLNIKL